MARKPPIRPAQPPIPKPKSPAAEPEIRPTEKDASPAKRAPLLTKVAEATLWVVIFLAPILGGVPSGALSGGDVNLNALRGMVLLAALLHFVSEAQSPMPPTIAGETRFSRWSQFALWAGFGWTLLSLLVHSRFLTSPVLLFAMLPATIDWLCYALLFTLALRITRRQEHSLFLPLLASAGWVAVVGILDYRGELALGKPEARVAATFFSQNFAAGFFALVLPPLVALYLTVRERYFSLGIGAICALSVGTLAATGSRIGIAAAAVGLLSALILAVIIHRGALPWARLGILVFVFAVIAFGFRAPLLARADTNSKAGGASGSEQSVAFRTYTWKGTLRMAEANPLLGTGAGTFQYRYPPYSLVASTQLAHQSYLQTAAEQGFPTLIAVIASLALALLSALLSLFQKRATETKMDAKNSGHLLLCGLVGGLVAGLIRSLSDSEWSLLGNAFPFWAVAGMVAAGIGVAKPIVSEDHSEQTLSTDNKFSGWLFSAFLIPPLILTLMLLSATNARDTILHSARLENSSEGEVVEKAKTLFPPDPDLYRAIGDRATAAEIEPSGKRFYQLAQMYRNQGETAKAALAFENALRADPNNLQTWRAVAEFRAETGDKAGALAAWKSLIEKHEGLVGKVRAISELPETHPAFAYTALGDAAREQNDLRTAKADYEKAAVVVDEYSKTPLDYQEQEVIQAQMNGLSLSERRKKLGDLYDTVMEALKNLVEPADAERLTERAKETKARLAKLLTPDSAATGN